MRKSFIIIYLCCVFHSASPKHLPMWRLKYFICWRKDMFTTHIKTQKVAEGSIWIDESGISHRVYNSVEDIFKELDAGEFNLGDNESRVFYVFLARYYNKSTTRGRPTLINRHLETKGATYASRRDYFKYRLMFRMMNNDNYF